MSAEGVRVAVPKSAVSRSVFVSPAPKGLLQRQCACGGKAGMNGECVECRKKRLGLQRKPVNGAAVHESSGDGFPQVHEVLRTLGRSLETATRTELESRLGHDFSRVRIHTDGPAVRSARDVGARAYTVGNHVVFGEGAYRPHTDAGRRLLTHELVHTLQQRASAAGGGLAGTSLEIGPPHDSLEREAERLAEIAPPKAEIPVNGSSIPLRLQRVPFETGLLDPSFREGAPFGEGLEGSPGAGLERRGTLSYREATELARCIEYFGESQEPPTCTPNRDLTWNDFTGTPPSGATLSANTRPDLRKVAFTVGSAECRHIALGEPLDVRHKIQAFLDTSATWVQPRWKNASDPALNGCDQKVADCEAFFDREAAAGRQGGTWRLAARTGCPATVQPDPSAVATSRDECSTVLLPPCNQREEAESARLLRHEQLHFDFGCILAKKANEMLASGGDAEGILQGARALLQPLHNRYDHDTNHGCLPGPQADWEQRVGDELPRVNIRPRVQRRRRRGRRRRSRGRRG